MSDIQDLFHTNDTQEPSTEGWADKVRTRRRRRHIGAGGLAAIVGGQTQNVGAGSAEGRGSAGGGAGGMGIAETDRTRTADLGPG